MGNSRRSRIPLLAGITAFVLVMLVGAFVVLSQSSRYSATSTVVMLPGPSVGVTNGASYFDTLSHGQIATTAQQIFELPSFKTMAANEAGLSPADASSTSIHSVVQVNTYVLTVTATADTGSVAEKMADGVVAAATPTIDQISNPYQLTVVSQATHTAAAAGKLSLGKFAAVLIVAGLALAIGVQQGTAQLIGARRRRPGRATVSDAAPDEPGTDGSREQKLDDLTSGHEDSLDDLTGRHEDSLDDLTGRHEDSLDDLTERIERLRAGIDSASPGLRESWGHETERAHRDVGAESGSGGRP